MKTRVFYLMDSADRILDTQIGENKRAIAQDTLTALIQGNDSDYLTYSILELEADGQIHENGKMNVLTTLKLNGKPQLAIINQLHKMIELEEYINESENDYRKYELVSNWIGR